MTASADSLVARPPAAAVSLVLTAAARVPAEVEVDADDELPRSWVINLTAELIDVAQRRVAVR